MNMFFQAVEQQANDRGGEVVPDLESYIDMRRDTSGCKPVFDLIEYALGFELPEEVVDHPVIKALNQGANDLVTWSNVRRRHTPHSYCLFACPVYPSPLATSHPLFILLTFLFIFSTSSDASLM